MASQFPKINTAHPHPTTIHTSLGCFVHIANFSFSKHLLGGLTRQKKEEAILVGHVGVFISSSIFCLFFN